jgi:hypothetical protein
LNKTITHIVLACTVVALAACQTAPVGDPARSAELKKFTPSPAVGQVYVCRDSRFLGAAVTPTIEVNGRPVANLTRNTYYYMELPPGDHTIIAKTFEHDSKFPFKITAGEQIFFQTWISFGVIVGRGLIDTIPAADGKKCVTEADLAGPIAQSPK